MNISISQHNIHDHFLKRKPSTPNIMNFSGRYLKIFLLTTSIYICALQIPVQSQSIIEVPSDVEFAGVTIHLTEENRSKVKQEIQRLYVHPENIDYLRRTTNQLAPHLAVLFRKANIPNDFLYVALPSSDTDTLGFWKLSQRQARRLNLQADSQIDERFHPLVSTVAVLSDINYWQKAQKNYASSLLCYLNGSVPPAPERITEHYFSPGTQSTPLFWEVLARKLVLSYVETTTRTTSPYILYECQNSAGRTLQGIVNQLQVPLDRAKTFNRWIKADRLPITKNYPLLIQVTPEEYAQIQSLRKLTEETKPGLFADNGFPILRKLNERHEGFRASALFYRINDRRGIQAQNCDNLITLAYYGNISVKSFAKYNDLNSNDIIRPGEIYYLESKAKRAKIPFHIVQKSQTLHRISNIYGVKLNSLQKFNYVSSAQRLQTGRILWLQRKRPTNKVFEYVQAHNEDLDENEITPAVPDKMMNMPDAEQDILIKNPASNAKDSLLVVNKIKEDLPKSHAPFTATKVNPKSQKSATTKLTSIPDIDRIENASYHVVQPGQTLYRVSVIHRVRVSDLMRWNNLASNTIKVGQKLLLGSGIAIKSN